MGPFVERVSPLSIYTRARMRVVGSPVPVFAPPSSIAQLPRLSLSCMAAYWTGRSIAAGSLGKRFLFQIRAASPLPAVSVASPVISSRVRAVHESSYDKNVDEQVRPCVVPDYAIDGGTSDKYWGPHPTTGVFGPADDGGGASAAGIGGKAAAATGVSGSSEVEKTVWFRLQEGVDKAPYA